MQNRGEGADYCTHNIILDSCAPIVRTPTRLPQGPRITEAGAPSDSRILRLQRLLPLSVVVSMSRPCRTPITQRNFCDVSNFVCRRCSPRSRGWSSRSLRVWKKLQPTAAAKYLLRNGGSAAQASSESRRSSVATSFASRGGRRNLGQQDNSSCSATT